MATQPIYVIRGLTTEQANDLLFAIANSPIPLVRSLPLTQNLEQQLKTQADAYNASLKEPQPEAEPLPTLPESIAPPAPVNPE